MKKNENENENETIFDEAEDILAKCKKCHDTFIQKYWDDEISWYIELNNTSICSACTGIKRGAANQPALAIYTDI